MRTPNLGVRLIDKRWREVSLPDRIQMLDELGIGIREILSQLSRN